MFPPLNAIKCPAIEIIPSLILTSWLYVCVCVCLLICIYIYILVLNGECIYIYTSKYFIYIYIYIILYTSIYIYIHMYVYSTCIHILYYRRTNLQRSRVRDSSSKPLTSSLSGPSLGVLCRRRRHRRPQVHPGGVKNTWVVFDRRLGLKGQEKNDVNGIIPTIKMDNGNALVMTMVIWVMICGK